MLMCKLIIKKLINSITMNKEETKIAIKKTSYFPKLKYIINKKYIYENINKKLLSDVLKIWQGVNDALKLKDDEYIIFDKHCFYSRYIFSGVFECVVICIITNYSNMYWFDSIYNFHIDEENDMTELLPIKPETIYKLDTMLDKTFIKLLNKIIVLNIDFIVNSQLKDNCGAWPFNSNIKQYNEGCSKYLKKVYNDIIEILNLNKKIFNTSKS